VAETAANISPPSAIFHLVETLRKAGRLSIGDKNAVTYHD
jgi:hypothetical protein